jgi:hypothetical protein
MYNFIIKQHFNIPHPTLIWHQAIFYCLLCCSSLHSYKFKDDHEVETSVTQWLIEEDMDVFQTRILCNSKLELQTCRHRVMLNSSVSYHTK